MREKVLVDGWKPCPKLESSMWRRLPFGFFGRPDVHAGRVSWSVHFFTHASRHFSLINTRHSLSLFSDRSDLPSASSC